MPMLHYRIAKRTDEEIISPGRFSHLSGLRKRLAKIKKDQMIIVETDTETQRLISRRLRSNIFKWKRRYSIRPICVRILKDGRIRLTLKD